MSSAPPGRGSPPRRSDRRGQEASGPPPHGPPPPRPPPPLARAGAALPPLPSREGTRPHRTTAPAPSRTSTEAPARAFTEEAPPGSQAKESERRRSSPEPR